MSICLIVSTTAARAQTINLINDAEIEAMLRDFSAPLFKAAGINRQTPIYIINDRRFNAFVVSSGAMFINYGTIIDSETPNALKAVIAHEIGHLAGGHLQRLEEQQKVATSIQAISTLLGIGVLAAAAGTENSAEIVVHVRRAYTRRQKRPDVVHLPAHLVPDLRQLVRPIGRLDVDFDDRLAR